MDTHHHTDDGKTKCLHKSRIAHTIRSSGKVHVRWPFYRLSVHVDGQVELQVSYNKRGLMTHFFCLII